MKNVFLAIFPSCKLKAGRDLGIRVWESLGRRRRKKYLTTLFLYERHKTCMGKNARMQLVAKLSAAKNARLPSYNSQVGFIHTRQLELAPRKGRRHDWNIIFTLQISSDYYYVLLHLTRIKSSPLSLFDKTTQFASTIYDCIVFLCVRVFCCSNSWIPPNIVKRASSSLSNFKWILQVLIQSLKRKEVAFCTRNTDRLVRGWRGMCLLMTASFFFSPSSSL